MQRDTPTTMSWKGKHSIGRVCSAADLEYYPLLGSPVSWNVVVSGTSAFICTPPPLVIATPLSQLQ